MKIYENVTVRKEILELLGDRKRYPRKMWSVTALTCCPRATYWRFIDTEEKLEKPDEVQLTMTRGRAHHTILEVYPDKEKTVWREGVIGHFDMKGRRICEIYTTMLGSKKVTEPSKVMEVFGMKVRQLMAYLYMAGEVEGDLVVFYLMGDYSKPVRPELKVYTLIPDEGELKTNWEFLYGRKLMLKECLEKGTPPLEKGYDFECINCPFRYACIDWLKQEYGIVLDKLIEAWGLTEDVEV